MGAVVEILNREIAICKWLGGWIMGGIVVGDNWREGLGVNIEGEEEK